MIALAITFLLALTAIAALVSVADSALRGWHSYRALASELRAMRTPEGAPADICNLRKASAHPAPSSAPRSAIRRHRAASSLRAAA